MTLDLARLATEALAESKRWPTNWCAEMTEESMNYDGQPPFFRCWSADCRDGGTEEMALGSEDYDDKLATFIALLANSTPQLARGYLEAVETLRKQTLLWQALGDNTSEVEDLTRDRDEYKMQHDNALASWAVDRKNLEDAAHRSRCDLLDEQTKSADLTRQLAEARAEIERLTERLGRQYDQEAAAKVVLGQVQTEWSGLVRACLDALAGERNTY